MRAEFVQELAQVKAEEWDELWNTDYPFVKHGFLATLEASGSVAPEQGWQPHHLLVHEGAQLVAAMPLYIKGHSYGEYVFDWQWANAYEQAGRRYYPKLLNAIPFTPATGPRFAALNAEAKTVLFAAIDQLLNTTNLSGFHSLFPDSASCIVEDKSPNHGLTSGDPSNSDLSAKGLPKRESLIKGLPEQYLQRLGCQFHWFNQDYQGFEDFLQSFSSRKRKNINKERNKVTQQNITITRSLGSELTPQCWRDFYQLYATTYIKRSGHEGYLNEDFFIQVGNALANHILMVRAYQDDQLKAAALYFFDNHHLYGRYWGAHQEFDSLHFECCYYQGIEFAIENKLKRFDPGAQGEHKISRGFTPVLTQSYHYLSDPSFQEAISYFLKEEGPHHRNYCQDARKLLPFKEDINIVRDDILL